MTNNVEFLPINISIVTISDTRNLENDKSGDVLVRKVKESGHKISSRNIVKDDFDEISELFKYLIHDKNIDVIISTGGTGLTGRDITPEVMKTIFEKSIDGLMAKAIDSSGIQFRMLNRSRGPAVHGPRSQADRKLYKKSINLLLKEQENLTIVESTIKDLKIFNKEIEGVVLENDDVYLSNSVVLTTGTFLGGIIHIGDEKISAGRIGDKSSVILSKKIRQLGLPIGRLKTGTPPRLEKNSINWQKVEMQSADVTPVPFSYMNSKINIKQIECGITRTNLHTHKIISDNISLSPVYSGLIEGSGPRYCPSIEDKVNRFNDKNSHQIFLEPEGLDSSLVYPNGISTSLPKNVQDNFVKTIVGLENVKINQYGYAIEYDYMDPRALNSSLEVKEIKGLFFAGQINGTTGYEEAAVQGIIAGINASIRLNKNPKWFLLDRSEAYIGVMIDDLITRGAPEPYRMFTSRAEYRLLLRSDNADQRLTEKGIHIGVVGNKRKILWNQKNNELNQANEIMDILTAKPSELKKFNLPFTRTGKSRKPKEILSSGEYLIKDLFELWPDLKKIPNKLHSQLETDCRYNVYLKRQQEDINAYQKENNINIPLDFDFNKVKGLSNETKDILKNIKPNTIAQASKLPGFTPTATLLLLRHLKKKKNEIVFSEN